MKNNVQIFTTGGTIDKIYFDALSEFSVGDTKIGEILTEANVGFDWDIKTLMKKDSLELTDDDRDHIIQTVKATPAQNVLITHGTDTMVKTGLDLKAIKDKTIVLTGAMQPASLRSTDAVFNIGFALAALRLLPFGVYIAMNGQILDPARAIKDRDAHTFRAAP